MTQDSRPIRRHFVDTDLGQMHVRITKAAPAQTEHLICLHMSPQSGAAFMEFMKCFGREYSVIAPDYPGLGETDCPPEMPPVRIEDYARTIWQALEALGVENTNLLGHHTGSKVAVEMARQKPDRVKKIILMATSIIPPEDFEETKAEKTFDPIPLDAEGTRLMRLWQGFQSYFGDELSLQKIQSCLVDALRPGEAYQWGNRAAFLYNEFFTDVLKSLPHPITVINPNDDLYSETPKIMDYVNNGELIDKPDWHQDFLFSKAEDAANIVMQILEK